MNTQAQNRIGTSICLRSKDLFPRSAVEGWKEINRLPAAQVYPAGTKLFQQGSPVRDVYFIEHGLVKLTLLDPDGREVSVGLRLPGWIIAAAGAIIQKSHLVSGITLSECRLRRVSSQVFRRLLQHDARLSRLVHQMHSHEVYDQVARLAQLGGASARHRLEQLLWNFVSALEPSGSEQTIKIDLPLKQREVAELIAVTPPYLSHLYKEMEEDGILQRRNGWLIIPDPQQLWHWDDC